MAWQAKFNGWNKADTGVSFSVTYADGERSVTKNYNAICMSDDTVKKYALNEIELLTAADTSEVQMQPGASVDLTPFAVAEPSKEEQDAAAFSQSLARMNRLARLVELGVLPADDTELVELQKFVATNMAQYRDMV